MPEVDRNVLLAMGFVYFCVVEAFGVKSLMACAAHHCNMRFVMAAFRVGVWISHVLSGNMCRA